VFQKILHCLQVRRFQVPCQPSGRWCHPIRTLICPLLHPSGRRAIPFERPDRPCIIRPDDIDFGLDPTLYQEAFIPVCIRPDVSAARPNASKYLTKLQILSKFIYGKIDAIVRTTWIPVRMRFSIRQELQFEFNRPDASLPSSGRAFNRYGNCAFNFNRPDACLSWFGRPHYRYGNYVLKINRPDSHPPRSGRTKALYGNYFQRTCYRPDAALKQERFSVKISEILVAQLSVRKAQVHRQDCVRTYYSNRPFEPSAYK